MHRKGTVVLVGKAAIVKFVSVNVIFNNYPNEKIKMACIRTLTRTKTTTNKNPQMTHYPHNLKLINTSTSTTETDKYQCPV